MGNLISLEVLDLGDNLLTGAIPPVLANYQLLSKFSKSRLTTCSEEHNCDNAHVSNGLSARFVAELILGGTNGNGFSGPLPLELTLVPNIQVLDLGPNGFSGFIPPEYGLLTSLSKFGLPALSQYKMLFKSLIASMQQQEFWIWTALLWRVQSLRNLEA